MSEHEHRLFEMEKSTEESSPLYTQQYEERFYPAHQKLRLERKLSLFALTLEIILAAFSVYWSARFFPDFYAGNPWVLLIFLNAGLVNALFYVLSWKLPQKMFIHERLLVSIAWGVAMILIYMSSGLPVLPFVWVGALLLLGLLFRFMRSAAQQRPMS